MTEITAAGLFDLHDHVAIVTGATSGIGLVTARVLATAGARVTLVGLPSEDPEGVARRIRRGNDLSLEGFACDVTDDDGLRRLVETVTGRHGRIDTVFSNAGIALDESLREPGDDRVLDRMFDVHVRSVLHLADFSIPTMADGGGGSFIIMSSLSGLRGNKAIGLYGITKAANAQLARNLSVQWGPRNVRVNALSPGVITTEFARPITDNEPVAEARLAKTPLRRFGEPTHIAGTVVWLASAAGSFVSGQNIVIDGGTLTSD